LKKCSFTLEEDLKLFKLHKIYGNKWAEIKKAFADRSFDQLKNRFNCAIKKNSVLYEGVINSTKGGDNKEEEIRIRSLSHRDSSLGEAVMWGRIDLSPCKYDSYFEIVLKSFEEDSDFKFSDNQNGFYFDDVNCL
jgi:hypothetical protein